MKPFLTTFLLLGLVVPQSSAQILQPPKVTSYKSPVKGEIQAAIKAEMDKARNDATFVDTAGIAERMDEAFPYLDDYINDPNDAVRFEVVSILSHETSARSLKLIVRYMKPSSSAFGNGINSIYRSYSKDQIVRWGGADLQRALFLGVKEDADPQAILLLSCFGTAARPQLNEIRKLYPNGKARFGVVETWLSAARITFYCDLALSQTEDAAALARLKERLSLGSDNDRATLLAASKFLNTKSLLRIMVSLIQDKRDFRYYRYYAGSREKPRYSRICDIAWGVLRFKTGADTWLELNAEPQSDATLRAVALLAKKKFAL